MDYLQYITQMNYLGWFTVGLVLILLEFMIPGVFLLWFGLAAFVMGILTFFVTFSLIEIGVWFSFISVISVTVGCLLYKKIIYKTKSLGAYEHLNDMAAAYIGKVYNLSEDVNDGRAKAKVGDTFWLVDVNDNLKKGDRVKIIGVENGVVLKAERYTDNN